MNDRVSSDKFELIAKLILLEEAYNNYNLKAVKGIITDFKNNVDKRWASNIRKLTSEARKAFFDEGYTGKALAIEVRKEAQKIQNSLRGEDSRTADILCQLAELCDPKGYKSKVKKQTSIEKIPTLKLTEKNIGYYKHRMYFDVLQYVKKTMQHESYGKAQRMFSPYVSREQGLENSIAMGLDELQKLAPEELDKKIQKLPPGKQTIYHLALEEIRIHCLRQGNLPDYMRKGNFGKRLGKAIGYLKMLNPSGRFELWETNVPKLQKGKFAGNVQAEVFEKLQYEKILDDGNCLFSAVAADCGMTTSAMRAAVVTQLRDKKMENPYGITVDFDTYVDGIATDKVAGGKVEIDAMADLLQRPIVVIRPGMGATIHNENAQGAPIFLYNHGKDHYDRFSVKPGAVAKNILEDIKKNRNTVDYHPGAINQKLALITNILRLYVWYTNDPQLRELHKEGDCSKEINKSTKMKNHIEELARDAVKAYLQDSVSAADLRSKISQQITKMEKESDHQSSRIYGSLQQIHDLHLPVNEQKYQAAAQKTAPEGILIREKVDNDGAENFIRNHMICQISKPFTAYEEKIQSGTQDNAEKLRVTAKIQRYLNELYEMSNKEKTAKMDRVSFDKLLENTVAEPMQTSRVKEDKKSELFTQGEFGKAFIQADDFLKAVDPFESSKNIRQVPGLGG